MDKFVRVTLKHKVYYPLKMWTFDQCQLKLAPDECTSMILYASRNHLYIYESLLFDIMVPHSLITLCKFCLDKTKLSLSSLLEGRFWQLSGNLAVSLYKCSNLKKPYIRTVWHLNWSLSWNLGWKCYYRVQLRETLVSYLPQEAIDNCYDLEHNFQMSMESCRNKYISMWKQNVCEHIYQSLCLYLSPNASPPHPVSDG